MNLSFEATYDPASAGRAERAFYVRSVLELRRFATIAPPFFFLAVAVAMWKLQGPGRFSFLFSVLVGVSILAPVFFYLARPVAASRFAIANPVRQITLTEHSIQIVSPVHSADIAWSKFKHVWETPEAVLLVAGRFAALSIPKRSLPSGAIEFIRASVGHEVGNDVVRDGL